MVRLAAEEFVMLFQTVGRLSDYHKLIHGFSTRLGGVSQPPHTSLNLAYTRPDDPAAVLENRQRFAAALGFSLDDVVIAGQVHGTHVHVAQAADRGRGAYDRDTTLPPADAVVTNVPDLVLWTSFADCVPLLFFDPVRQAVGVAHAGWKGTVDNIAGAVVETMSAAFGSDPADLLAVIGPSIGPCCYEVAEPVISAVSDAFGAEVASEVLLRPPGNERPHFDLWAANVHWLEQAGVHDHNIVRTRICTACNVNRFFSHRRENGQTGRCVGVIGLCSGERTR
jgi:YfiH family protein